MGVPKLLRIAFVTSCLVFPTDGAKCGFLISQSLWIVEAFISYLQSYKTKRRWRWWSVAHLMAKSVFFPQDSELGAIVAGFIISYFFRCNLLFFYGGRKDDPSFLDSGRFLPIMLGKDDSYFGKDDSFFSLHNHLPVITSIKGTYLFCRRRRNQCMSKLTLIKRKSGWHLHLGELLHGKVSV